MRKIVSMFSLILVLSLVLAACSPAPPQETLAVTEQVAGVSTLPATVELTVVPAETATEAPAATVEVTEAPTLPAATEAPLEPTESVTGAVTLPAEIPGTGLAGQTLASTLLTQTVTASDGQEVGVVGDLAVNLNTTHVDYVILRQEAPQDAPGPIYIPIPWRGVQFTDQGAFLAVDSATLEGATTFDIKAAPVMIPSDWDAEFGAFWEEQIPAEAPAAAEPSSGETTTGTVTGTTGITGTSSMTGTGEVTSTEPISTTMQGVVLTNALMSEELLGPNGESIGTVSDVIIDMNTGLVTYVLLQPGEALGLGDKVVPVPLPALIRDAASGKLAVPIDLSLLNTAPNFDLNSLPDMSAQDWDTALRAFWQSLTQPSP